MSWRRRAVMVAAVVVTVAAATGTASHAFLDRAQPPVGSTTAVAPREIRLWFTEPLEAAFSSIALEDAAGRVLTTGTATVEGADRRQLALSVPTLAPGQYRVRWRALSVDTHITEGSFTFRVAG